MEDNPPTLIDAVISFVIGGFLGWITGGLWNMLQGRTWNGEDPTHKS